jgi:hypothetical protein
VVYTIPPYMRLGNGCGRHDVKKGNPLQ